MCEPCTRPCLDSRHLVEIKTCGATFNRECHCEKGFYCSSKAQYTCRRCLSCPSGTFSSVTSLESMERTCKQHTNCTNFGLVMISEGNNTRDHQCGPVSTTPATAMPITKRLFSTLQATTVRALEPTNTFILPVTEQNSSSASSQYPNVTISQSSSSSAYQESITTTPLMSSSPTSSHRFNISTSQSSSSTEHQFNSPAPQGTSNSPSVQSLWLLILVCLLLLAVLLAGFCRGKRLKKLQEYCGLSVKKETQKTGNLALTPQSPEQPLLESLYNESREVAVPEEAGAAYSGRQQITVDQSGGGESVKNTVGSIYIYSPGMVVLGANSSERREEPVEGQAFISTPQQESLREPVTTGPWVRCPNGAPLVEGMQEEDHKLSYPVPATGK